MNIVLSSRPSLFREALASLLKLQGGHHVVLVGDIVTEAEVVRATSPDVLLIDTQDAVAGLDLVVQAGRVLPKIRVLVLADEQNEDFQIHALRAGARGILSKGTDLTTLQRALGAVGGGELWASHRVVSLFTQSLLRAADAGLAAHRAELTDREWEVLALAASGRRNKAIAGLLSISEYTVKAHMATIFRKLNAETRLEAVLQYYEHGQRGLSAPQTGQNRDMRRCANCWVLGMPKMKENRRVLPGPAT